MKIALVGGHLSPLLAVLSALPKDEEVFVIGRKHNFEDDEAVSLEYTLLNERRIPFEPITTGRLHRRLTPQLFFSLSKVSIGFIQSYKILKTHKPDVVLSFGGYMSIPVGFAARLLGIPFVIHEQTREAGVANKLLSKFAVKVCISWRSSEKFFPKEKTILTGNPISNMKQGPLPQYISSEKLPLIYITGGSSGSHSINVLIEGCMRKLASHYRVIHQSGDAREYNDFERLCHLLNTIDEKHRDRYHLTKFLDPDEVGPMLKNADLVISRSGINTVTELLVFKKVCLLIPLPYGQKNEQLTNALFLKQSGIAEIADQFSLTSETLFEKIQDMISRKKDYVLKQDIEERSLIPNASSSIINVLQSLVR